MGALGYKVVPIPAGEKYPKGFGKWQEIATDDAATIERWFADTTHGIGWAMGRQPNGQFVFAVDVEADGIDTLIELLKEHGQEPFFNTACQATGGAGMHFVFTSEVEVFNSAKQFAPKIDIRGEGGQILIGPTIHPNGNPYQWQKFPNERRPLPAPEWVMERIVEMRELPVREASEAAPAGSGLLLSEIGRDRLHRLTDDLSPADWVRENISVPDLLIAAGWTYMETRGTEQRWCRPGKDPRKGHSAVLHDDGAFNVFSTEVSWRGGKPARGGCISFSPIEVMANVAGFDGDIAALSSHLRRQVMPRPQGSAPRAPDIATERTVAAGLNLPPEFWEARPWLTTFNTAALARGITPDAVFLASMARVSALIPPTVRLPPIIGSAATLDWMGCLVGDSSAGKTAAANVAEEILPSNRDDILWKAPIGSGEGLVQAFMGRERDEKGKPTGDPSYLHGKYHAVQFSIDEGTILHEQAGRRGTTIIQTLMAAWSGQQMGQLNAGEETNRLVPAGKRRVALTINIQTEMGHLLLTRELQAKGFTNRLVFAWAQSEPLPRADRPDFPDPIRFTPPPTIASGTMIDFPDVAIADIDERHSLNQQGLNTSPLDGHSGLLQMKLAAMFALLDGETTVTDDDWALAAQVLQSHRAVRNLLLATKQRADRDAIVTQGTAQGLREMAATDVKERQAIARLSDRIVAVTSEGPIARSLLRKRVTAAKTKHRFDDALAQAVDRGAVEIVDAEHGGITVRVPGG